MHPIALDLPDSKLPLEQLALVGVTPVCRSTVVLRLCHFRVFSSLQSLIFGPRIEVRPLNFVNHQSHIRPGADLAKNFTRESGGEALSPWPSWQ